MDGENGDVDADADDNDNDDDNKGGDVNEGNDAGDNNGSGMQLRCVAEEAVAVAVPVAELRRADGDEAGGCGGNPLRFRLEPINHVRDGLGDLYNLVTVLLMTMMSMTVMMTDVERPRQWDHLVSPALPTPMLTLTTRFR